LVYRTYSMSRISRIQHRQRLIPFTGKQIYYISDQHATVVVTFTKRNFLSVFPNASSKLLLIFHFKSKPTRVREASSSPGEGNGVCGELIQ
jgi:hypothetical protein